MVESSDLLLLGDVSNLDIALSVLEDRGYTVHVAAEADYLSKIRQISPEAVLLPAPGISNQLKSNALSNLPGCIRKLDKHLPIVLLCDASCDAEYLQNAIVPLLEQGATDYIVDTDSNGLLLVQVVAGAIEKRHLFIEQKVQVEILARDFRRLERDQRSGLRVQNRMLPDSPAQLDNFILKHRIFASIILSGDSVNYFQLSDKRVLFYLADVSGHGVASALVSVALGGLSRRLRREFDLLGLNTSADVLGWFNKEVLNLNLEQHITMFVGILDDKLNCMQYSNAAHFPGAIMQTDSTTKFLEMGGLPLGICETRYEFQDVDMSAKFDLVLFSDGVLEIMSQTTIEEKEQCLLSLVQSYTTDIDTLVTRLGLDSQREVPDDIAIFTVTRSTSLNG